MRKGESSLRVLGEREKAFLKFLERGRVFSWSFRRKLTLLEFLARVSSLWVLRVVWETLSLPCISWRELSLSLSLSLSPFICFKFADNPGYYRKGNAQRQRHALAWLSQPGIDLRLYARDTRQVPGHMSTLYHWTDDRGPRSEGVAVSNKRNSCPKVCNSFALSLVSAIVRMVESMLRFSAFLFYGAPPECMPRFLPLLQHLWESTGIQKDLDRWRHTRTRMDQSRHRDLHPERTDAQLGEAASAYTRPHVVHYASDESRWIRIQSHR